MSEKLRKITDLFVTALQDDYKKNGVTVQNATGTTSSGTTWRVDTMPKCSHVEVKIKIKQGSALEHESLAIDESKVKLSIEPLNVDCVIFDAKGALYLEEFSGIDKAIYWTGNIESALILKSVDDASNILKSVSKNADVHIRKLNKGEKQESQIEQSSRRSVTRYILLTAFSIQHEPFGVDIARQMVDDAGISLESESDMEIIKELGDGCLEMIRGFKDIEG